MYTPTSGTSLSALERELTDIKALAKAHFYMYSILLSIKYH